MVQHNGGVCTLLHAGVSVRVTIARCLKAQLSHCVITPIPRPAMASGHYMPIYAHRTNPRCGKISPACPACASPTPHPVAPHPVAAAAAGSGRQACCMLLLAGPRVVDQELARPLAGLAGPSVVDQELAPAAPVGSSQPLALSRCGLDASTTEGGSLHPATVCTGQDRGLRSRIEDRSTQGLATNVSIRRESQESAAKILGFLVPIHKRNALGLRS